MPESRRTFLASVAAFASGNARNVSRPVIDTHVHFYDPGRPQGVPWPPKTDTLLYKQHLPADFRKAVQPANVQGVIVVEASPWLEDNQWVLDLARDEPLIVGAVGNLPAGTPAFARALERFGRNPLFRGIRLGEKAISAGAASADFQSDIRRLSAADLELDVIGGASLLPMVARLSDRIPELRIVIDHLPFVSSSEYRQGLQLFRERPHVYAKVSGELAREQNLLDELWDVFTSSRLIYASNWPVSNKYAPYGTILRIVQQYFESKGPQAADAFFRTNAKAAYRAPALR